MVESLKQKYQMAIIFETHNSSFLAVGISEADIYLFTRTMFDSNNESLQVASGILGGGLEE